MHSPDTIRKALRAVKDPELNLNIIDIGLVYDVEASEEGDVHVKMTLTSPGCPAGGEIIEDVKKVAGDLEGVRNVEVELVWDPYWTRRRWTRGSGRSWDSDAAGSKGPRSRRS
jgi:metal-sulfur cluster biosynthetic enzyme